MTDAYVFQLDIDLDEKHVRVSCIFIPSMKFTESHMKSLLQDYFDVDGRVPPDILLFVGTSAIKDRLAGLCSSALIQDCLPALTRFSTPPPIRGIVQSLDGTFEALTQESEPFIAPGVIAQIREQGLLELVMSHDTILRGQDRVHFIKPAGTHCSSFIRTANALVSGAGTFFVAFWLIPHITAEIEYIYTDTASINGLVLCALLLRLQIKGDVNIPIVDSFGSYAGLPSYEFRKPHKSLFVISSSTSAGLEKAVGNRLGIPASNIITILSLRANEGSVPAVLLCDITREFEGSLADFKSFNQDKCPYCLRHIPAVAIGGDQFLVNTAQPEAVLLRADHSPKWLRAFLADFIGKGVLRVHRILHAGKHEARELFVDLEKVLLLQDEKDEFTETAYRKALSRWVDLHLPASLKHIVYINEAACKALSDRIIDAAKARGITDLTLTRHTDIPREDLHGSSLSGGTLLVVGGVVATGQTMMEVNQLLRDRAEDSVIYLAGMTRTSGPDILKEISTNIRFGDNGVNHFPFSSILDIYLPDHRSERPSPWDQEVRTWRKLKELSAVHSDIQLTKWLNERIAFLESAKVVGLERDLFLPNLRNENLRLRKGFVFWPGLDYQNRGHSQADVYFTIAAVLHTWRDREGSMKSNGRKLLVSPRAFYRFNDGIIQAAILRSAEIGELDYRTDQALSVTMREFLSVIATHCHDVQGEAVLEFLLAIFEHRLLIQDQVLGTALIEFEDALSGQSGIFVSLANVLLAEIGKSLNERFS